MDQRVIDAIRKSGGVPKDVALCIAEALIGEGMLAPAFAPRAQARREVWDQGQSIQVRLELSVAGYRFSERTLVGTVAKVIEELQAAFRTHFQAVSSAWERHGDHRAYCPRMANGYPSRDPCDGDVVGCTVLSVGVRSQGAPDLVEADQGLIGFLDEVAKGHHQDPIKAAREFFDGRRGPKRS